MPYAEVSVNSPSGIKPTFSYHIPEGMEVQPGQAVWVPFGRQLLQGIVISTGDSPEYEQTRDIAGIVDPPVILPLSSLQLGKWLSAYYRCPLFQSLALMLPPGFGRSNFCTLVANPDVDIICSESLSSDERELFEKITACGLLELKNAEKILGKQRAQRAVSSLARRNLIFRNFHLSPARISPKMEVFIELAVDHETAGKEAAKLAARSPKQAMILYYLEKVKTSVSWREVSQATSSSISSRKALEDKGLVAVNKREIIRRPIPVSTQPPGPPLKPNNMQQRALDEITSSLKCNSSHNFLLHGVTGSGKTEVYLQALDQAIRLGKKAIVLVPEISLTPQIINRFTARFPNQVAVLHSTLSLGERFDQWREIKEGKYNVVIGARSALFAPQPDLGLVVMDEEHEWSYKQDTSPRYHTRTAAQELCRINNATLVLGSATPDVETYYKASTGEYRILKLSERITQGRASSLPEVEVVDLREELKTGNRSIFSRALQTEIRTALDRKDQVILFLNRRGGATFVQCRSCGYVAVCRRCRITLSYHPQEEKLVCHHCNLRQPIPGICPQCLSKRIKYLGLGTQGVEIEITSLFPKARILRWDSDTTRNKGSHGTFLKRFIDGKADILIGTQMIAKGMDFPGVSLVGVINADIGINLPDFRAGEHAFSLLCQVAGRAGRGDTTGKVIIQSYFPDHYAIQAAANHDYEGFFNTEIAYRRSLKQPPFSRLARLIFSHTNDDFCRREALRLKMELSENCGRIGIAGLTLIGPVPAFYHRLRGRYRWSIIIKGPDPAVLLEATKIPPRWKVDIDPLGLD
ncbi:MAG: primosomal protein N' [Dehalococcoidales bacterium]|nr:primosomal protein N' [Dehalococcoidales bacterium]NLE90899.1 primosomal protein N' [Dehalococcoidales bacterium]